MEELVREIEASAQAVIAAAHEAAGTETAAGEWPPATIVGHLADVDAQVWQPRLGQMLVAHRVGAPRPSFTWWEPDAEDTASRYAIVPLESAADLYLAGRRGIAGRLRGLSSSDWRASARHATFGDLDVAGLCRELMTHDAEHLATLRRVVASPA